MPKEALPCVRRELKQKAYLIVSRKRLLSRFFGILERNCQDSFIIQIKLRQINLNFCATSSLKMQRFIKMKGGIILIACKKTRCRMKKNRCTRFTELRQSIPQAKYFPAFRTYSSTGRRRNVLSACATTVISL